MLTADAAETMLDGQELIAATSGSIAEMKALRDRCLGAGIPALVGCPGGGTSCGSRTHLLVGEASLGALGELLGREWRAHLEREGLAPVTGGAAAGDEPPCPACGTAAPLVDGACSDCGLQLG